MTSAVPSMATEEAGDQALERGRSAVRRWSVALTAAALYGVGLAAQLVATTLVNRPLTEGSSYYVTVARNLIEGRGLVIDAIWSYGTPPLVLPRPAFELWQPLASFIAALPMPFLGTTFDGAQVAFGLLGATLAPLAWLVARDAVRRLSLPGPRAQSVTVGAGVLTALSAPLLIAGAAPDSTMPFAVFGTAACLLVPRAIGGNRSAIVALGIFLGLAYLTRMEAAWFGLAFVVGALITHRSFRRAAGLGLAVAAIAALIAAPWWLRNLAVFGTPLPGQLADNVFLTRNEEIFGYVDRATLAGFLGQGAPHLLANVGAALWHNLVDVLLIPAGPIAALGLLTFVVGLSRRGVRPAGALAVLLGAGAITYAATSILFPVATLWGTFEHAAGPLHVGLVVAALIGADAFVARVRDWRSWPRANAWLAPLGLALIGLPIAALTLAGAAVNATANGQRIDGLSQTLPAAFERAGVPQNAVLISDRPIWLSDALHRAVIALPDEAAEDLVRLASDFKAGAVVVTEPRGSLPAALRAPDATACFNELAVPYLPVDSAVFVVSEACR
jgi:hypothetical protein